MKIEWLSSALEKQSTLQPIPFQQSQPYGDALRAMGREVRSCVLFESGHAVGQAQVLLRHSAFGQLIYLPRGPVLYQPLSPPRHAAALALIRRSAGRGKNRMMVCNAETAQGDRGHSRAGHIPIFTPQTIALLDLAPNPAQLRANLQGKWRNGLNRAESGTAWLHHAPMPPDPNHWLLQREAAQRKRLNYRSQPLAMTVRLAQACPDSTRIFTLMQGLRPIAAMLFALNKPNATYLIGWSGPEGRRSAAHQKILWQAMLWLKSEGYLQIDLGLIETEVTAGLARFKLGTGAKPCVLGHSWLDMPLATPLIQVLRKRTCGHCHSLWPFSANRYSRAANNPRTPHGSAQHRHHRPR